MSDETEKPPGTPGDDPEDTDFEMVPLYASPNFAEVELLVDVLEDHGIRSHTRKNENPGFPVSAGEEGEIRILVQDNRLEDARSLVEEALSESPEPDDGKFLA